ncbi:hypothetical protein Tco_0530068 [Tanacetum coccineum]
MQMVGGNGGNQFRQYVRQNVGNQNGYNAVQTVGNQNLNSNGNGNVVATWDEGNLLIAQKEEARIQLQAKEFDFMAAAGDLEEIEQVNANCILMANLSTKVHHSENCYNNDIFNMFTQEEQYTKLLEPIPEPHQDQQNDSNVISAVSNVEQSGGTAEQHPTIAEETQKHDPPAVYDSEETLQLAQESCLKMKQLNKEIKLANYAKIQLSGVFVSQKAKSREELYFLNASKMTTVSKSILIPNKEFSDDTSPSVAGKFLNEAHQEIHKIVKDEIFPIFNQVDARLQNFKTQFLKEAAKFVRDFKSLTKEADESLAKHKALELEIECLLRAVVCQDIMSIVQSNFVVHTSNLQTELDQCKYDKISYDKAYNDMQQKSERLQAQLGDLKGKSKDTPCESEYLDPLSKKLENENVELDNTKNDRVPSASKSSCIKNKEVELEEHHRNLLPSKNKKHMSSECNIVKLDIQNNKSEVVCAMCKQCLVTTNHDVCVLNYVNGMNSHGKKQKANVSNIANQTKLKPKVKKPNQVGFKERLASPKLVNLEHALGGRIFDLKGKIIASSKSECQSDISVGDNACTSNPQEPIRKRFPDSTFSLAGHPICLWMRSAQVLQSTDRIEALSINIV